MAEPVLFLDVDGVLCTPLSVRLDWLLRRPMDRQLFDPIALFWLERLVRRTGAQVVLSSSWRYSLGDSDALARRILQNLYRCLADHGAPMAGIAPILWVRLPDPAEILKDDGLWRPPAPLLPEAVWPPGRLAQPKAL